MEKKHRIRIQHRLKGEWYDQGIELKSEEFENLEDLQTVINDFVDTEIQQSEEGE